MERLWYSGGWPFRLMAAALLPAAGLYRLALRLRPKEAVSPLPVISVGNLTLGGNGKTTLVIDLALRLKRRGVRVAVVLRGYGRVDHRPLEFDSASVPPARLAGDEPVLLARRLPGVKVLVDADRRRAARRALDELGAEVVLADDAFQHQRLGRALDIVAINARRGFGNGRLFPAGPLREPLSALRRAHMLVFTYAESEQDPECLRQRFSLPPGVPIAVCSMQPEGFVTGPELMPAPPPQAGVVAFCGVGDAPGFFSSCRAAGLALLAQVAFPDHHFFTNRDLESIGQLCRRFGTVALCSEKDLVRIERKVDFPLLALRSRVLWADEKRLEDILDEFATDWIRTVALP